jgi:hypothetical protein
VRRIHHTLVEGIATLIIRSAVKETFRWTGLALAKAKALNAAGATRIILIDFLFEMAWAVRLKKIGGALERKKL